MHPGDLSGGFSDLEMTWSFTALAPPLGTRVTETPGWCSSLTGKTSLHLLPQRVRRHLISVTHASEIGAVCLNSTPFPN